MKSRFPPWRQVGVAIFAIAAIALLIPVRWSDMPAPKAFVAAAPKMAASLSGQMTADTLASRTASDTPPDVPQEEWERLKKVLAASAEGQQHLQQAGAYLTFKHRAEKWEEMQQRGERGMEKNRLAQQLLEDLPIHVGRGEVTGLEARALEAQLLEDTTPDVALRQQAMIDETRRIAEAEPQTDPQAAEQVTAYKEKEKAITAQWLAMPEAERNPEWLESRLDAARRQIYDGTAKSQANTSGSPFQAGKRAGAGN